MFLRNLFSRWKRTLRVSLLAAGPCLMLAAAGFVVSTELFLHNSIRTTGIVVSLREVQDEENHSVNYAPVFQFVAEDGQSYTISSDTSSNPSEFAVRQKVPVLYEPKYPMGAKIDSFLQLWLFPLIFGIIGLIAFAIGYVWTRLSKRVRSRAVVTGLVLFASVLSGHAQIPEWCKELPRAEFKNLERVRLKNAESDAWFEVYRIRSGVFAIYEPRQAEETIGYLIVGAQRALLFDSGMGIGDVREVTAELTKLPVVVLNSHTHFDHVGGNWQFDTVYGMDTAFTRGSARGGTEVKGEIAAGQICGKLPEGFDATHYQTRPWKIARFLHDGDVVELGGRRLMVIATPGHTPDAICLWDAANGLLFTGDTYYKGTVWLYRPETDLAAYGRSVQRLAGLAPQVKVVLGAHNVPVMPPAVLPELAAAFEAVRAGKVVAKKVGDGKVEYRVGEIGFLMKAAGR